jgi:hypothetical protein
MGVWMPLMKISHEDLGINNCRAIGESDAGKLRCGLRKLKTLQFEVDVVYRYLEVYGCLPMNM